MWELDQKEGWAPKNWCFRTVVLKKSLESPLDSKEIHPVNPKGNQPWIFTGRTDAEAEAPILWPLEAKSLENTLILGKTEKRRRRGQQRMRGLHHWLNGNEFEQTPGDSKGHRSLTCCSPTVYMTWLGNWTTTTNILLCAWQLPMLWSLLCLNLT